MLVPCGCPVFGPSSRFHSGSLNVSNRDANVPGPTFPAHLRQKNIYTLE